MLILKILTPSLSTIHLFIIGNLYRICPLRM